MFARVTSVSVQPDKVAEVVRIYNESILPAVKAASGDHGVFLLIDAAAAREPGLRANRQAGRAAAAPVAA